MATITIRGTEYKLEIVTDAITRTISQHVDNTLPLAVRHQSTWDALNACLEPALPAELFKRGILVLNDAEIVPILQAIANALAEDANFKGALDSVKDLPGMGEAIAQLAVFDPAKTSLADGAIDGVKSTLSPEQKAEFLAKLADVL